MGRKIETAYIIPTFHEPNGNVSRFLELAKKPETQKEYSLLLAKLKAKPHEVGKKLREATWKGKSLGDILEALGGD